MTDKNSEQTKVIDFRVRVPPALWPQVEQPPENYLQYEAVLDVGSKYSTEQTLDALIAQLDKNRIDHAVMHAEYEAGDLADTLNSTVAEIVMTYPERFSGVGTVSMANLHIMKALRQIEACAEMGMIGISLQPAFFDYGIDDRRLYPLYAKAVECNLLVALHTGINYTLTHEMSHEHPMLIDRVACAFPELTIVASHAGWPWATEMVAIARKHPNVYIEFGGLAPKYIAAEGAGWEVMYRFMNSVLREQILFGTDWPTMDHQRTVKEWREMKLKPSSLGCLLHGNASRLIKHFSA